MDESLLKPLGSSTDVAQLDGLALLKVMKHCHDAPDMAQGVLLGLDREEILEVTNCFPLPSDLPDREQFQVSMMESMKEVNCDAYTVGWYLSANCMSRDNAIQSLVEGQFRHQKDLPFAVVLIYDPVRTTAGNLSIKCYRLTDTFMKLYGNSKFLPAHELSAARIDSNHIFQEVQLKVHNAFLVHSFLYELVESKSMSCEFDRLDIHNLSSALEKNLQDMAGCIDGYVQEQRRFHMMVREAADRRGKQAEARERFAEENARRKAAGKEPLPESELLKDPAFRPVEQVSRLNSLLHCQQLNRYTHESNLAATEGMNKVFVIEALAHAMHAEQAAAASAAEQQ